MATQLDKARLGTITPAMRTAARFEGVAPEKLRIEIAAGRAVLPANPAHKSLKPFIVGHAFKTKVNANIGRSPKRSSISEEMKKLDEVISAGAEFVMDLSVGPALAELRKKMLAKSPLPLGTVPIYETFSRACGKIENLTAKLFVDVIREQAEQGVDFMTLHAGLLRRHVGFASRRLMGIVSRGGSIMAEWMVNEGRENMLYERWDEIMDICSKHDVTVSLGDGLRPGCQADASDKAQFAELDVLGDLVLRCRKKGVQVMVEGPGHVPYDQIQMNMEREFKRCHGAPFYVLGPVVTDIGAGYDHITSAIGGTAAAYHGAAMLCYVTPSEHLGLPSREDVRVGIMAHRIAAHAADIAKGIPGARDRDDKISKARIDFDWKRQFELMLDGEAGQKKYNESRSDHEHNPDFCSMCGKEFCAMRTTKRVRKAVESLERCRSKKGKK